MADRVARGRGGGPSKSPARSRPDESATVASCPRSHRAHGSACEPRRVAEPRCPSAGAMPAPGDPANERNVRHPVRGGCPAASATTEQPADPLGLEPESVADVFEGEGPAHVGRVEPLRRLFEQTPAAYRLGGCASTEGPNRILEHRGHKPELRRALGRPLQQLDELHREHLVRH
jgi:hypothetical protein